MDHTIFLFFFGGFVAAFAFLLLATFIRYSNAARILCYIAAFCGLIYEAGCFAAANSFGKATGGGDDRSLEKINGYIAMAAIIAILWIVILSAFRPIKKRDKPRPK